MYKRKKSILTMMLVIVFLCTNTVFGFAQASDIEGHWAKDVIQKWAGYGIVKGTDGLYRPNDNISRAEFVVLVSRVLKPLAKGNNSFSDIKDNQWYADDVLKAFEAGFIQGDGKGNFMPAADITRQEAAVVLYKAFDMKPGNVSTLNLYKDGSSVADWAKEAVAALVENKYMSGKPGNLLAPKDKITRAETINLLNNIAGELKYEANTYTGNVETNLVVNTPNVVLKDMIIKGNLYIAHGVGDGDIELDNVTVMGRTIVRGGGENSIKIKNSNLNGTLVVLKQDGKVRIVLRENSSVANVELVGSVKLDEENLTGSGYGNVTITPLAAGAEIEIEGDIEELIIEAPQVQLNILDGTVEKLTITDKASDTKVEVAKDAVVKTLIVEAKAEVSGTGKIEKADIKAADAKVDEKLTKTETPSTPSTPATGGTGGSGGSGTGGSSKDNIYLSNVILYVDKDEKVASGNGKEYDVDLKSYSDAVKIKGINISAPSEAVLKVTSVTSKTGMNVTLNKSFTLPKVVSVADLLGSGNSDVSLGSMRAVFGEWVKVSGTLSRTGYSSSQVSFTMILDVSSEANIPNQWVDITTSGRTITATIKEGKGDTKLASIGVATFIKSAVGELPVEVSIDDNTWTEGDSYEVIKKALTPKDKTWADVTISDLVGKSIKFKKSGDANEYAVVVKE